jgi:two-component system, cell cycle response regulator
VLLQALQERTTGEPRDVGKLASPDAILNKSEPLDDGEWEFVRRHSGIGERIVAAAPRWARSPGL